MDLKIADSLTKEFTQQMVSQAGAATVLSLGLHLTRANGTHAAITGVLFSDNAELRLRDIRFFEAHSGRHLTPTSTTEFAERESELRFMQGEGGIAKSGQLEYPHFMRVHIKREEASSIANETLRQLDSQKGNGNSTVKLSLQGRLERIFEDATPAD